MKVRRNMVRKFPGQMPGKGRFIVLQQTHVIGNTNLEVLMSKMKKKPTR
jgi:hypothetical protein